METKKHEPTPNEVLRRETTALFQAILTSFKKLSYWVLFLDFVRPS